MEPTSPCSLPQGGLLCSQPLNLVRVHPMWQACRRSCLRGRGTRREAGLGTDLLPKKDPFHLSLRLASHKLTWMVLCPLQVTQPKWKLYPTWLLWEINERLYTFSITRAGTEQMKYYCHITLSIQNEDMITKSPYLYLHTFGIIFAPDSL